MQTLQMLRKPRLLVSRRRKARVVAVVVPILPRTMLDWPKRPCTGQRQDSLLKAGVVGLGLGLGTAGTGALATLAEGFADGVVTTFAGDAGFGFAATGAELSFSSMA